MDDDGNRQESHGYYPCDGKLLARLFTSTSSRGLRSNAARPKVPCPSINCPCRVHRNICRHRTRKTFARATVSKLPSLTRM